MKVNAFEVTVNGLPIVFASPELAGAAAMVLQLGLVSHLVGEYLDKAVWSPAEPQLRRIELDMPAQCARLLAGTLRKRLDDFGPERKKISAVAGLAEGGAE